MANDLGRLSGGVIGHFTPAEITIDITETPELGAVGDNVVGLKVPKGKLVYGAYIKNLDGDLASGGSATVGVKVGAATILSATAISTVKSAGLGDIGSSSFETGVREVKLIVGTAALTAGKITIGVIYG